LGRDGSIGER